MSTPEERIAVLEAKLSRNEIDITKLFQFIRDHMEKEEKHMEKTEKDRKELLTKIDDIEDTLTHQKSFIGGMMFTVSAVWVFGSAIAYWIFKLKT